MTDTAVAAPRGHATEQSRVADVEIVVPVRDEQDDLVPSITRLRAFLDRDFLLTATVTIADNGSSDGTWALAVQLAERLPDVSAVRIDEPGRGRALARTWGAGSARVLAYMDVDLSTDLNALLPLVAPLVSGHSDLAIGTRLSRSARVLRGPKREVISRAYNLLLRATLGTRFSDAQCGFKAIRADAARKLLPLVRDTGWFFDTELLVLAERAGLRIHEVPVDWHDDPDSRVDIVPTVLADLRGIVRLAHDLGRNRIPLPRTVDGTRRSTLLRQLGWFCAVGTASTAAYLLSYVLLRAHLGSQGANALALLLTAVANTAANRRLTFGVRGRGRLVTHQAQGLVIFGLGLLVTSGALAALTRLAATTSRLAEVTVLVAANLVATGTRFVLLRGWVFGRRPRDRAAPEPAAADVPPAADSAMEALR